MALCDKIKVTHIIRLEGIETPRHRDTLVNPPMFVDYDGRAFAALVAPELFERIDAAALLDPAPSALAIGEAKLRADMLGWSKIGLAPDSMLARYAASDTARMTCRPARLRAFRRQAMREVVLFQDEASPGVLEWRADLAPGTRASTTANAERIGLVFGPDPPSEELLFEDLDGLAWAAYLRGREPEPAERRSLTRTRVTEYKETAELRCAYTPWLGITRGRAEDVCEPFGERQK